jgi:hypothetical protein
VYVVDIYSTLFHVVIPSRARNLYSHEHFAGNRDSSLRSE